MRNGVAHSLLDLIGDTPLVELRTSLRSRRPRLRKARGPEPDRLDQGPRREGDDRDGGSAGELRAGSRAARADERQHGDLARGLAKLKGYQLTCVMPENATEERKRLLRLFGAEIVYSPGDQGSNGAVRLALELAERDPSYFMPFQYANEANPRAHYEGTGAEIVAALDRVDVARRGPRHRRHADGRGRAAARGLPDVVVAAAEPLPGDPVMGLRSLDEGYVPPILDVSSSTGKCSSRTRSRSRACATCSTSEACSQASRRARSSHVARKLAARARRRGRRRDPRGRRLEVPVGRVLGGRRRRAGDGAHRLVVIPADGPRGARRARAGGSANEACGLITAARRRRGALRSGAATPLPSPYRFELESTTRDLVRRGRGLRARRLPLAPGARAAVTHRHREHRPLGGEALPRVLAAERRPGRLPHRRRPDRQPPGSYFVTLKLPFMPSERWMSHWYVYLPGLSLIVQVLSPTNDTLVFLFTPGPNRWKLWIEDLSSTLIL